MEDVSDTVPPVKKAKKSLSLKMSVHSDKKSEAQEKKPLLNGTGHSSSDESTDLHSESAPNTPKVVRITKTSKAAKTEQSRGRSKSPNKQVSSSEKISQCDSPSGSAEDSFHGFDTDGLTSKQDQFLKLIQKLGGPTENGNNSEVLEENSELNESEAKEEMTVDVEPGLDSDGESEHDSDEMEIDMGNDKENVAKADPLEFVGKKILSENTKDSDVEIMETDSVKSDVEKSDKIEDESNLVEPSKPETPGKGGQLKLEYCGSCSAVVDDAEEGICCDGNCERWFHLRCSGLSQAEYDELSRDENAKWACEKCSGKPPTLKPDGKPLLSVRKDLGNLTTPSPFAKRRSMNKDGTPRTPKIDVSNPAFLKPFDFGWKRELVYRSTSDSNNRRQGDIYYYTPKGKKLRSLREISEHLAGTDLTQDNFTFWKEPLGLDDPEREIIREAKLKVANKEPTSSPAQPKKIVPKITKTPKTVPKLTATVSPMESSGTTPTPVAKASASVTPRIVIKGKSSLGPKFKITPSKNNVPGQTPKLVINKGKTKKVTSTDEELEIGMLPPTWDPLPKPKDNKSAGVKRSVESNQELTPTKRAKTDTALPPPSPVMHNFMQNVSYTYGALLHAFQYLKVQELLRASRVCHMWRDIALHKCLWETVRMKNSHVKDWEGFAATLRRVGARHLDLRKILVPDKPEAVRAMWTDCVKALSKVNSLVKLDLCRCTSGLLEQIANVCPQLEYIAAGTLKSNQLNMTTLGGCQNLVELKLKGQGGFELSNVSVLGKLSKLKYLSLTTVKNTSAVIEVVGSMTQLESLELGDFMNISEESISSFSQLTRLKRLRLEKGQAECPTDTILKTISQINSLVQLELINFDVKAGFEESLALCSNIRRLLIIPTYVTQSATTNHLVIEGVSKLASTLQHFVWGLTLELLRVTDLFIDQWETNQKTQGAKSPNQAQQKKSAPGDSIPILKPANKNQDGKGEGAVTQVDVLQLAKLHKVLTTLLPSTKIIILKVPFIATWRQTISGSPQ